MTEPTPERRPWAPGQALATVALFALVACPLTIVVGPVAARWTHHRRHNRRKLATTSTCVLALAAAALVLTQRGYVDGLGAFWTAVASGNLVAAVRAGVRLTPVGAPLAWVLGSTMLLGTQTLREHHPIKGREARDRRAERALTARAATTRERAAAIPLLDRNQQPILGTRLDGDHPKDWTTRDLVTLPADVSHLVAIGATGSGKTQTILRVIAAHLRMDWRVIVIDGKEEAETRDAFLAIAATSRISENRVMSWPEAGPIDLFRGEAAAIKDRWMAAETYTEAYYRGIASTVLALVTSDRTGPPRTPTDFISRIDLKDLAARWHGHPNTDTVKKLTQTEVTGVATRYFAKIADLDACGAIPNGTDSGWSWEDTDACWITLPTATRPDTAASLARVLLLDLMSYLRDPHRRPDDRRILLVVEEMGALTASDPATALAVIEGVERARSAGVRCVLSAQTIEGLGDAGAQARLLHGGPALICHRTPNPEPILKLLGTRFGFEASIGVNAFGDLGDQGSLREQHQWQVAPDTLRRLPPGCALLIHAGRWALTAIAALPIATPRPRRQSVKATKAPTIDEVALPDVEPNDAEDWTSNVWDDSI